jgi:hypothetical protein
MIAITGSHSEKPAFGTASSSDFRFVAFPLTNTVTRAVSKQAAWVELDCWQRARPRNSGNVRLGHFETGDRVVKEQVKIATAEEAQSLPSERSDAREFNKSSTRIANTLHRFGLTIIVISIIDNLNDFIVDSRHLTKHTWLSSFDRVVPYSLWIGVLLVFAGIVVRDRKGGKEQSSSD